VNEFLSPFFNKRNDAWGGSEENRFRFLREIYECIRKEMPQGMPLLIKLNADDYTPKQGITPDLAARYAARLAELGIDGIEVSCGTYLYSGMNIARGDVPVREFLKVLPWWARPMGRRVMESWIGKYALEESYNLAAAKLLRQTVPVVPIILVGGMRRRSHMEEIVGGGHADLISMSRPLIREPDLVNRFSSGQVETAACTSCNKCTAAYANDMPTHCYCG